MVPKATFEQKAQYSEKIREFKEKINAINPRVASLEKEVKKKGNELVNYHKIALATVYLQLVDYFVSMNRISQQLLSVKNEGYLNTARKNLYKILIVLEEVFGKYIDTPVTERDEFFKSVEKLDDQKKLNLAMMLFNNIQAVVRGFGANTKWKWSFVELEGRFSTILKNMCDFKAIQAKMDPRIDGFAERQQIMTLLKEQLKNAANRYREKYEISTKEADDLKKAIDALRGLHQIHSLFKERDEANKCKKGIELWQAKLEEDLKTKESTKKEKKKR